MKDLNDLYIFALIVEHGGLSKVEQKTGISKSKLSRRLSNLALYTTKIDNSLK
ncbi:hypothetical protein MASRES_GEN12946_11290 [Acinetobacter baumannii]